MRPPPSSRALRDPTRSRARLASAAAAAAIALAAAPDALAAGLPTVAVHRTEDASSCPDARALAARVAAQMKAAALDPLEEGASTAAGAKIEPGLDVQIYRSEKGFTAVMRAGTKTRQLSDDGANCAGLADALAISIAILLDTEPLPPPPEPPPSPEPPPVTPPAPPAPAPPRVPASFPEVRSFHVSLALSGAITEGLVGSLAASISGELELRVGRFSIAGGVLALPGQTIPFASARFPLGEVDVSLVTGFLRACGTIYGNGDAERLALCAAPVIGSIRGEGHNYVPERSTADLWVAAAASALYQRRIAGPFSLGSRATLFVPFTRQVFTVENLGRLDRTPSTAAFTSAPVGVALDLELRVSIW